MKPCGRYGVLTPPGISMNPSDLWARGGRAESRCVPTKTKKGQSVLRLTFLFLLACQRQCSRFRREERPYEGRQRRSQKFTGGYAPSSVWFALRASRPMREIRRSVVGLTFSSSSLSGCCSRHQSRRQDRAATMGCLPHMRFHESSPTRRGRAGASGWLTGHCFR